MNTAFGFVNTAFDCMKLPCTVVFERVVWIECDNKFGNMTKCILTLAQKYKKMRYLLILLTLFSLSACKNEPTLTARCYVRYLEDENRVQSKIEVRKIGQQEVAALKMAEVRFVSGAMEHRENNIVGHFYQSELLSFPSSAFEFMVSHENKEATIQFDPIRIANFSVKEGAISKSKGFTIVWTGTPLAVNEDITVTITDELGITAQAIVKGPSQSNEKFIPAEMYSGLKPGKATFFLVRTAQPVARTKNIEAKVEMGFYTKSQNVNVVD